MRRPCQVDSFQFICRIQSSKSTIAEKVEEIILKETFKQFAATDLSMSTFQFSVSKLFWSHSRSIDKPLSTLALAPTDSLAFQISLIRVTLDREQTRWSVWRNPRRCSENVPVTHMAWTSTRSVRTRYCCKSGPNWVGRTCVVIRSESM